MKKISDKLFSWASLLEPQALDQAFMTSKLPFVLDHVALMPDAHAGEGSTIGSVIPTVGAIVPSFIGVDIGCGVIGAKTQFHKSDLDGKDLSELRHSIERSIPLSPGNGNKEFTTSAKHRVEKLEAKMRIDYTKLHKHPIAWRMQLGSLGGGNHFWELCLDESDNVWVLLHSGSRGIGHAIATHHIKIAQDQCRKRYIKLADPSLACLTEGEPEFNDYITDMSWAQEYAFENREEMLDRSIKDLSYFMTGKPGGIEIIERINNHHNYTHKEHHLGRDVWLTRKGAVSAREGQLAIIPGSMGTASYIVEGRGNIPSFCSAPHGAGRKMSRTQAREQFKLSDLQTAMHGIEYREDQAVAFIDEIPGAYKPIDQVMEDSKDLVAVKHTLHQVLNVKGT